MKVITRHLTKEILSSCLLLLLGLMLLFALFDLVKQAGYIGSNYSIWTAVKLAILILPTRAYQVLPIAVLLGAVYTLSRWARDSEFTVLRTSGLSPWLLARMLFVPGILMVVITYALGEWLAPTTYQMYGTMQAQALNRSVSARGYASGVWLKDIYRDNHDAVLNVRFLNVSDFKPGKEVRTGSWRVFEFTPDQKRLLRIIHAKSGAYVDGRGWRLDNVVVKTLPPVAIDATAMVEKATTLSYPEMLLPSQMKPDVLGVLSIKPEYMSAHGLWMYIEHLKETKQTADRYSVTMWNKVFYPLAIFAMLALAMPFAYLNVRSGGMSLKIFGGLMIGIVFYALNNVFSFLGVINTWPPFMSAILPTLAMLGMASLAVRQMEHR